MSNKKQKTEDLHFAVLAVDVVAFAIVNHQLMVRLVSVNRPPAFPPGSKGFPGGLIRPTETAELTAQRLLADKAGIDPHKVHLEQLYTFSAVDRDPRGRVVAVSYLGVVSWEDLTVKEKENTPTCWWHEVSEVSGLAYDHDTMLGVALDRLKSKVSYTTLISKILPHNFTLGELERSYELIVGKDLDKRNFRKKIDKLKILVELNKTTQGLAYRPARLYRFKSNTIKEIEII